MIKLKNVGHHIIDGLCDWPKTFMLGLMHLYYPTKTHHLRQHRQLVKRLENKRDLAIKAINNCSDSKQVADMAGIVVEWLARWFLTTRSKIVYPDQETAALTAELGRVLGKNVSLRLELRFWEVEEARLSAFRGELSTIPRELRDEIAAKIRETL